jgi:hypothetical protein
MKTQIKLILILLIFLPVLSFGQNIDANLKYINEQFSLYNEYQTSFSVDIAAKEIICEDDFGVLKAKFSDVEIREEGDNVGIFCLNENSKCIRYYDKNGTRLYDQDYSDYTMGLRKNDKIIPHINTVLSKFAELKRLVTSTSNYSTSTADNGGGNSKLSENLRYINEQFRLYNGYETSFSVDMKSKEVICEDKFGILKANWSDVEIREKGSNVGIFCLNENSKCIRGYKKTGERDVTDYVDYTMGLRENDKMIPHINTVLSKFAEIKNIVLNSGGSSSSVGNNTKVRGQVEAELSIINQIFERSSQYKNIYSVDYATKTITAKTESCRAVVPVKSGLSLNYYKRDGTYGEGFYFENSDKSILESCTSFEDYTEKTYEYVSNYNDVQTVIRSLNKIISLLQNSSMSGSSYGTSSGNTTDLLRYINEQFSKYNAYNTVYSVDYAAKKLIWKNDFGTNSVDFNQVEVRADYESNWIGVYCLTGKCISQITTSGATTYYDKYTMSLNEGDKMIGHIDEVVSKFAALKQAVVSSSKPTTTNGSSPSSDDPDK